MRIKEDQSIRKMIEDEWIDMFYEDRDDIRRRVRIKISEVQQDNRRNSNTTILRRRHNRYYTNFYRNF